MPLRFLVILFFFLAQVPLSYSQKKVIYGTVTDSETKEVIPYAAVGFPNTPDFVLTDEKGKYQLEAETLADTLMVKTFGYEIAKAKVKNLQTQKIDFKLQAEILESKEISFFKDGPEVRLVKKILKHKDNNRRESLDAYEYEVYEKIKVGDKDHEQLKKQFYIPRPFRFFLTNIDTTPETTYLPLFITETLKEVYYLKEPTTEKEEVRSVKMSGLRNESLYRLFTDRTLNVYIYDNYFSLFNKNFISPLSDKCLNHYTYAIEDTIWQEGKSYFHLSFKPKHKQELTFTGDLLIADTSFAVKSFYGKQAKDANINFVTDLIIQQEYVQVDDKIWLPGKEDYYIHGEIFVPIFKNRHFYGRKTSTYKNHRINKIKEPEFYSDFGKYQFDEGSIRKSESYWDSSRHSPLTINDRTLYKYTDSLKNLSLFKNALVLFTGYKTVKGFQIGPWFKLYSYNPVEGHRFQLGFRSTPKFKEDLLTEGYVAYGTRDQRIKYRPGFQYFFKKMPRNVAGFYIKDDIEQLTWAQNVYRSQETILSTLFKISSSNVLVRNFETRSFYVKEWKEGFQNRLQLRTSSLSPLQGYSFLRPTEAGHANVPDLSTTELSLLTHWGIKEKYIVGDYKRTTLGSLYPIFDLILIKGFSNFLGGNYDYFRTIFSVRQRLKTGNMGYSRYRIEAGKIWGKLPYPFLELHNGNQSIFYDELSFNTMNFLEFGSDQYLSLAYTHFFDGYFFNKIPLIRKLKLREVISGKVLWGSLENGHKEKLIFPDQLQSLGKEPFAEAGFGIDNIFKLIRIDFLWRLTYLDKPDIDRFKIMGSLHISF